jgi:hypothetical protein
MTPEEKAKYLIDRFRRVLGVDEPTAIVATEKLVEEVMQAICGCSASVEPLRYWEQVRDYVETL